MASGQTIKRGPTLEKKMISAASGPVYFVTFSFFFSHLLKEKNLFFAPSLLVLMLCCFSCC